MTKSVSILCAFILAGFAIPLALDPALRALFTDTFAVHAGGLLRGQLWAFVTYQFLHGGWLHLALNLLTLISVGPDVERTVGARRFLAIYFISGILGAIGWLAVVYPVDSTLIGASASISGLLGALAALHPRREYTLFFLPLPLPAWLLIGALAASQVAYLMLGTGEQIAYAAHLAGGLAGWAYALAARHADAALRKR